MRRIFFWIGMSAVMVGAFAVFALAMPHHPFYGTQVEVARIEEREEPSGGFSEDATEAFDRFVYGLLGMVLCIGGAMIVESRRFGENR